MTVRRSIRLATEVAATSPRGRARADRYLDDDPYRHRQRERERERERHNGQYRHHERSNHVD